MKAKLLTALLTLLTFNAYAHEDCHDSTPTESNEVTKLDVEKSILQLYELGILSFDDNGELTVSDTGSSLIDELKKRGAFSEVLSIPGKSICY